jgi:hypothetical protein
MFGKILGLEKGETLSSKLETWNIERMHMLEKQHMEIKHMLESQTLDMQHRHRNHVLEFERMAQHLSAKKAELADEHVAKKDGERGAAAGNLGGEVKKPPCLPAPIPIARLRSPCCGVARWTAAPEGGAGPTAPEGRAGVTAQEGGAGVTVPEGGAGVTAPEGGAGVTAPEGGAGVTAPEGCDGLSPPRVELRVW